MLHLLFALLLSAGPAAADFDVLIRGGRVIDGTGNPGMAADVGIIGQRIAAMGNLKGRNGRRIIEAAGLIVAPGFIDIHNHSDESILVDGDAHSMIRQGVTTMVLGEGGSAAPSKDYPTFDSYFAALRKGGIATNIASYVGSAQIWVHVRGERSGPPTADERKRMTADVRTAMEQGALGVSSSLSGPPGAWIDTDTLVAMCQAAAPFGGTYSTHMRTEGHGISESIDEALSIGRRAGVPVDIIHLKVAEHALWGTMPKVIAKLTDARKQGIEVQANVYPYTAGQNNLATIIPPWAHEGGPAALIERLRKPDTRARIEKEILGGIPGWYNHYTATGGWDGIQLVSLTHGPHKRFSGKRMTDVIKVLGGPPIDVLFTLLIENGGSIPAVYFHHSEDDMRFALKQPFVSIGSDGSARKTDGPLSEGNPHPRYYGTFPRVLGRYVRKEGLLTLEDAIRKMTSANAAKIDQWDRGILRPGMAADVTLFDAAKIIDNATFEKPAQYPTGIAAVIVNGQLVLERGRHLGTRPGVILLRNGKR